MLDYPRFIHFLSFRHDGFNLGDACAGAGRKRGAHSTVIARQYFHQMDSV